MAGVYESRELALRFPTTAPAPVSFHRPRDRMGAGAAGMVAGLAGGLLALGVAHALAPEVLGAETARAAAAWGVELELSLAVAYGTAASLGGLVGACFAGVTRHLRRLIPLAIWSLVFFLSLAVLLVALAETQGWAHGQAQATAIVAAIGAFAVIVPLALPLRRRT